MALIGIRKRKEPPRYGNLANYSVHEEGASDPYSDCSIDDPNFEPDIRNKRQKLNESMSETSFKEENFDKSLIKLTIFRII